MAYNTRPAPKRRPKHPLSPSTRSNDGPTFKRPSKRIKRGFANPKNMNELDSPPDEPEVTEEPAEAVLDVSHMYFTVTKCCILNSTSVWDDTDQVKLGDFNYRNFEVFSIKRVAKAAEKANLGFEWDSGLAVISAKGVTMRNYLKINLDSDAGVNSWKKIEGFIERWMRPKTKIS